MINRMKNFTHQITSLVKLVALVLLVAVSANLSAGTFYVRPVGDATSWSSLSGITADQIITTNSPVIDSLSTYYFAKGSYVLTASAIDPATSLPAPIAPKLLTGKIYGGFSGLETAIDLAARVLEDKDANGLVEPWEFKNETVLKGAVPASDATGSYIRMLTLTGGEVNGVTFFDFYYYGTSLPTPTAFPGAIVLGIVSSSPWASSDVVENAGKLIYCTVRKLKAAGMAPVMMTNQFSVVDHCLFEECSTEGLNPNGGGGAIFMNTLGGRVQNSVFRNNEAKQVGSNAGRGGAIYGNTYAPINPHNNAIIENCLFYNNSAAMWGGALRLDGVAGKRGAQIINCTMVNNSTNGTGVACVELIQSGLIVNSIVLDDDKDEIRLHSKNFTASNIFGTLNGVAASPGTDMVPGKTAADLGFVRPTTFTGAIGSPDGAFFDQASYDAIRKANFKINVATSPAVTTPALSVLPSAYTIDAAIPIVNMDLSTKDLMGVDRTGARTLGAYQYSTGGTALSAVKMGGLNVYSANGTIILNELAGKMASVYSISGKLLKNVKVNSNNFSIPVSEGFYLVKVANQVAKVIVK